MQLPPNVVKPVTATFRRSQVDAKRSFAISVAALGALLIASNCDDKAWKPIEGQQVQEPSQPVETELARFERNADESLARIDEKLTHIQDRIDLGRPGVTEETHAQLAELRRKRSELANEASQTSDKVKAELAAKTRSLDDAFAELGKKADDILSALGDDQIRLRIDEQTAAPAEK